MLNKYTINVNKKISEKAVTVNKQKSEKAIWVAVIKNGEAIISKSTQTECIHEIVEETSKARLLAAMKERGLKIVYLEDKINS